MNRLVAKVVDVRRQEVPTALLMVYPDTQGVKGYDDLWPRGGVAIDLFGNAG